MTTLLKAHDTGAGKRPAKSVSVRGQLDMAFNVEGEHLATVRRIVLEHLNWWGVSTEARERLITAVNELLTNVLQHTEPGPDGYRLANLLVQRVSDGVTAVVSDYDTRPPKPAAPGAFDESGRGWVLLQAITDESSVSVSRTRKDVWVFVSDPGEADCDGWTEVSAA